LPAGVIRSLVLTGKLEPMAAREADLSQAS
jgi:hypothetical protein